MNRIDNVTRLVGDIAELRPLEQRHFEELAALAGEQRIWEHIPVAMSNEAERLQAFEEALAEREKGTQFPFVIVHKQHNKFVGSTRLMDIQPAHKKLEIGWTWLHPDYWATAVNLECKLLLLTFCFDTLQAIRVQLKTDEHNTRSRKAIEKIGARFEGILRHDRIRSNGTYRNSAYYSIINTEWVQVKDTLTQLLHNKLNEIIEAKK